MDFQEMVKEACIVTGIDVIEVPRQVAKVSLNNRRQVNVVQDDEDIVFYLVDENGVEEGYVRLRGSAVSTMMVGMVLEGLNNS